VHIRAVYAENRGAYCRSLRKSATTGLTSLTQSSGRIRMLL
jgi:hypothetical protein